MIESGKWGVGMRIPAEPELMNELNVSRNTLREAIRALIHAGLLKTKQGDGTYVCSSSALGAVLKKRQYFDADQYRPLQSYQCHRVLPLPRSVPAEEEGRAPRHRFCVVQQDELPLVRVHIELLMFAAYLIAKCVFSTRMRDS